MDIKSKIRDIPDFPKEGILFRDITTLLKDKEAFNKVINRFVSFYKDEGVQKVVGIESRGFIFGAPLAHQLECRFYSHKKARKTAERCVYEAKYELEYGTDTLAIHQDAISPGEKVLIVDDLLATGGTMSVAVDLIKQLGGTIVGIAFFD